MEELRQKRTRILFNLPTLFLQSISLFGLYYFVLYLCFYKLDYQSKTSMEFLSVTPISDIISLFLFMAMLISIAADYKEKFNYVNGLANGLLIAALLTKLSFGNYNQWLVIGLLVAWMLIMIAIGKRIRRINHTLLSPFTNLMLGIWLTFIGGEMIYSASSTFSTLTSIVASMMLAMGLINITSAIVIGLRSNRKVQETSIPKRSNRFIPLMIISIMAIFITVGSLYSHQRWPLIAMNLGVFMFAILTALYFTLTSNKRHLNQWLRIVTMTASVPMLLNWIWLEWDLLYMLTAVLLVFKGLNHYLLTIFARKE